MTGVRKKSTCTRNGITYLKSRYLTLSAESKHPGPAVAMKVITSDSGHAQIALKLTG